MSEATWEIRVGGEYKPRDPGAYAIARRVKAIDGNRVHYVLLFPGGKEGSPRDMSMWEFRKESAPEDQSPIPELLAALKAVTERLEDLICTAAFADQTPVEDALIQAARAAILRAESGAK